jgi:hypothetical protein
LQYRAGSEFKPEEPVMKKSDLESWEKAERFQTMFGGKLNAKLHNRIVYSPCKKRWVLIEEGGLYPDQGCKVLRTL